MSNPFTLFSGRLLGASEDAALLGEPYKTPTVFDTVYGQTAKLLHWLLFLLNPEETNTQKVAVGGVVAAAVGDATVLREVETTTTPVDAVRTG